MLWSFADATADVFERGGPAWGTTGVLTLSSTAVGSRKHYRDMMAGIAHTVSFHDPMPEIERAARGDGPDGTGGIAGDIASDFG